MVRHGPHGWWTVLSLLEDAGRRLDILEVAGGRWRSILAVGRPSDLHERPTYKSTSRRPPAPHTSLSDYILRLDAKSLARIFNKPYLGCADPQETPIYIQYTKVLEVGNGRRPPETIT